MEHGPEQVDPWAPPAPGAPPGTPAGPAGWSPYPPPPQGWGPAWHLPPPRPLNRWTVVALVTGLVALVPVAVPAAVTGLVQASRRNQRGTGLAVAGLVLSGLWTVFLALAFLGTSLDSGKSGALGRIADAGSTEVGTCLARPPSPSDSVSPVVLCTGEHDAEVMAVQPLGARSASWPGYDELDGRADDACFDAFGAYVGQSYDDSPYEYGYFLPDEGEWRAGERRVVCVVLAGDADRLPTTVRDGSAA